MCDIPVPHKRISARARVNHRVHRVTQRLIASEASYACVMDIHGDTHRTCVCSVCVGVWPFASSRDTHSSLPRTRAEANLLAHVSLRFSLLLCRHTRRESATRGNIRLVKDTLKRRVLERTPVYAARTRRILMNFHSPNFVAPLKEERKKKMKGAEMNGTVSQR